ncbi:hypothetical protein LF65_01674 [Clostridium beijerinckii]|uniref:beta-galactosidase n=1 Tax=Clostridium beijerinckii TaxID=1520 RepID=A0A0B5QN80_CLOBE|nr:beta-galactosidase [Clostridium beijerinckii]AJG98278.1 hypothetical protein LF65_01674 [Clostridium beijerinckii]
MNIKKRMVGVNYHPHDWSCDQWGKDLDSMKNAGFSVVRLGHLCWDSFEPKENVYTFEWMDKVMDMCYERGIKVFLDIPTRPAPLWLHKKYPSIDIVNESGQRLNANTRYMEDVGDPHFQNYALNLAEIMVKRYCDHPAMLAFGLCNELGSGFHSYSQTALIRFQKWLKDKYTTIENLNISWNTKRWSRKLEEFSDVFFPVSGSEIKGAPEPFLDMKRFFSDEILSYMKELNKCVKTNAPNIPVSTNHWAENKNVGFDYQKDYRNIIDYPGIGFYPGVNPEYEDGFIGACMNTDYRIGELDVPMWGLEFQTGTNGGYGPPKGVLRMYAYLSWVYRNDMVCAWTWRSMLGGEEQYLYGLLDHDGSFGWKYYEYKQIAEEWNALEEKQICRLDDSKSIAVAYSYDSHTVSQYAENYYKTDYKKGQVLETYKALFHNNIDCNIIDLRKVEKEYQIVIVPGHCLMDKESAATIRAMVENGATVIMTAYSAKVNENNQAFTESLPGYLSDVFGIKVRGFDRAVTHITSVNEGGIDKDPTIIRRKEIDVEIDRKQLGIKVDYHEFIELDTAEAIGYYSNIDDENNVAVTCNNFEKGKAIYVGIPANENLLTVLMENYGKGIFTRSDVPKGIITRQLSNNHQIYINTTDKTVSIDLKQESKGVLRNQMYSKTLTINPYEVGIIKF